MGGEEDVLDFSSGPSAALAVFVPAEVEKGEGEEVAFSHLVSSLSN